VKSSLGEIEGRLIKLRDVNLPPCGAIAQLGERIVRNDEVVGSIPTSSTNLLNHLQTLYRQILSEFVKQN
jgi:hypothetical protein